MLYSVEFDGIACSPEEGVCSAVFGRGREGGDEWVEKGLEYVYIYIQSQR